MNKTVYEMIHDSADLLKVDLSVDELALFAENHELTPEHLEVTKELFNYLAKKKHDKTARIEQLCSASVWIFDAFRLPMLNSRIVFLLLYVLPFDCRARIVCELAMFKRKASSNSAIPKHDSGETTA